MPRRSAATARSANASAGADASGPLVPYYSNGRTMIFCGDCRDILPRLGVFDAIVTDPPYVIQSVSGKGIARTKAFYREGGLDGLMDFDLSAYAALLRSKAPQLVAFHSRDQILDYGQFCLQAYGNYDLHVWCKTNAIPFVNNTWKSDIEYIALGWAKKKHACVDQAQKSKFYVAPIEREDFHPTQKPYGLMVKYLQVLNPRTVLDPFMGSGTTLLAARDLGITAVGIEREEKYCKAAVERLTQTVFQFHPARKEKEREA